MPEQPTKNSWHLMLGLMLKHLLTPLGLIVELEAEVMSEPPRADILLLRRDTAQWTHEQFAVLPDGIRATNAHYILLEFKYTESINVDALLQIANNQRLYLQSHDEIKPHDLKSFLISAKQPQQETLNKFGFYAVQAGLYRSNNCLIDSITLIALNTLPNTPNNAWLRCFASQRKHYQQAFEQLKQMGLRQFSKQLYLLVNGLRNILFRSEQMNTKRLIMDPEEIMEVGKFWEESYRAEMTVEERLEGLSIDDILSRFSLEDRLQGLAPEQRLQGLAPEERLQGLTPEQIEAYLQKLKQS